MRKVIEVFRVVTEELESHADELSRLDAEAGDGDLGVTATKAAAAIVEVLSTFHGNNLADLLSECGVAVSRKAPSTAGTLLATGLLGAGRKAQNTSSLGAQLLAELLDAAREAISVRGKAEPGAKTMIDALAPASVAAGVIAHEGGSISDVLNAASIASEEGTRATVSMVPRFGRASWLPDRAAGHEDAGARLIAIVFAAATKANESLEES
jgi:phosphoenolpyruvate---glycerone phosphotransferase subunit DhaL